MGGFELPKLKAGIQAFEKAVDNCKLSINHLVFYLLDVPDIPLSLFFLRKNKLDLSFFLLRLRESSSSRDGLKIVNKQLY